MDKGGAGAGEGHASLLRSTLLGDIVSVDIFIGSVIFQGIQSCKPFDIMILKLLLYRFRMMMLNVPICRSYGNDTKSSDPLHTLISNRLIISDAGNHALCHFWTMYVLFLRIIVSFASDF
jgi:hypothetical protein